MSFCRKCGQRLEDGEQKCSNCGEIVKQAAEDNKLEDIELSEDRTNESENSENTSFLEKFKKNKRKLIIIISAAILCLIFGGIGIAEYTKASQIKEGITLGNKYLQEQKYEEAILAFKKVIKVEPKNVEARVGLAKVYMKTGKIDEAEKVLKEAIGINPKKVEPYLVLAQLYVSKNKPADAIKILTEGYNSTNDKSIKTQLEDLKSKISVDNISKTITIGEKYSLPKEVAVKTKNIEAQFPVRWDKTTVDTNKAGTQTFNGILEDTDKKLKLTLNIIAISSIEDINNSINQNDEFSLPSKVTAKMTDESTREVEVTWNSSNVDTSKSGTFTYEGTVSGYNNKAKLTLNIKNLQKEKEKFLEGNWNCYKVVGEKYNSIEFGSNGTFKRDLVINVPNSSTYSNCFSWRGTYKFENDIGILTGDGHMYCYGDRALNQNPTEEYTGKIKVIDTDTISVYDFGEWNTYDRYKY